MRPLVAFVRELLAKQFITTLAVLVGIYTLIGIFVPKWDNTQQKVFIGLLILALLLLVRTFHLGYLFYLKGIRPVGVILVKEGTSLYKGRKVVILEGREWLRESQFLLLTVRTEFGDEDIAIMEVIPFPSAQFAQAVIRGGVQPIEKIEAFIMDSSRWKSLQATPLIRQLDYSKYEEEEYEPGQA